MCQEVTLSIVTVEGKLEGVLSWGFAVFISFKTSMNISNAFYQGEQTVIKFLASFSKQFLNITQMANFILCESISICSNR